MHPLGRISSKQDFGLIRRKGHRFNSASFSATFLSNQLPKKLCLKPDKPPPLIFPAFTVTKKNFKKAVDRNRIKRRLRPLIQQTSQKLHNQGWSQPLMINFYAKPSIANASWPELCTEFEAFYDMLQNHN
jgi:ribonuclease P protein component